MTNFKISHFFLKKIKKNGLIRGREKNKKGNFRQPNTQHSENNFKCLTNTLKKFRVFTVFKIKNKNTHDDGGHELPTRLANKVR